MASDRFEDFFARAIEHEGKVCEDVPGDRGGATKWGITIGRLADVRKVREPKRGTAAFDKLKADLFAMTEDEIKDIYRTCYWDAVRGDELPPGVDLAVADFGVNSGPGRAVQKLRVLCGIPSGTSVDERTLFEVKRFPALDLINLYCDERARFLNGIVASNPSQRKFLNGWLSRVGEVRRAALAAAKVVPIAASPVPAPKAVPVEPAKPSIVKEGAKSKSVWTLLLGVLAWIEEQFGFVKAILPDAQQNVSEVVDPLTSLGGMLKVNLGGIVAALSLAAILVVIYRHSRDKAALAQAKGDAP